MAPIRLNIHENVVDDREINLERNTVKNSSSKDLLRLETRIPVVPSLLVTKEGQPKQKYGNITTPPVSSVLNRVKSFLPQMKEAEQILKKKLESSPDDVNIENVENDDKVVEMNLSLFECAEESQSESETDSENDEDEETRTKLIQEI